MKKILPILLVLTCMAGLSQTARAENKIIKSKETLTAIDVTTLMEKGASSAEIADTLAKQWNLDRATPPLKGKTDEQVIYYLLANPEFSTKAVDKGKFITYKAEGETYLKNLLYDKAAEKFSLAMIYSEPNHDLYKLRGDSYTRYLTTNYPPASSGTQDEAKQGMLDNKRKLLCNNIYSDYLTASRLADKKIQDNITELNMLRNRMVELKEGNDPNVQYKKKSAENIIGMRLMQRTQYKYNSAKHANITIKKALANYKVICSKEDAERRDLIRLERDKTRDRKWVKYGEKDESAFFYNKSNLLKSKGSSTAWLRIENTEDVTSHVLVKVKLDCTKRTLGTIEYSLFDETGTLTSKKQPEKILAEKILPGSSEELLLGKICK
jgi:hypothetical protein